MRNIGGSLTMAAMLALRESDRQLEAAMSQNKWLPIESAPKDGYVLLFCPLPPISNSRAAEMEECRIIVGCYRGRALDANGWFISDIVEYEHGYYPGEFDWEAAVLHPTHWMPLPEPPK